MGQIPTILIFCPLEFERRAVVRAFRGRGAAWRIKVVTTGPGAEAVARAASGACEARPPQGWWYVLAGVAGGLSEEAGAAPGIGRIVDAAGNEWAPTLTAGPATIVGVDAIASTPEQKRALRERSGADLVDTESHAFARVCADAGVHWGIVRGVSDGAADTLPPEVARWVDARGRTRVGRVVLDLVARPGLVREVREVGRRSTAAMQRIGERLIELASEHHEMLKDMWPPLPIRSGTAILFGGSFDPPHRGHVELPERVRREVARRTGERAWLIYVPAGRSPFKADAVPAPARDRLHLVRMAISRNMWATATPVEIERAERDEGSGGGVSFTVDTVRWARERLPAAVQLRLLIGADQAAEFHRWKEAREIVGIAEPLVMLRGPTETADGLIGRMRASGFWSEEELGAWRGRVMDVGTMDVSATEARRAAARGDWPAVEEMVGKEVAGVIREKGLYGSGAGAQRA